MQRERISIVVLIGIILLLTACSKSENMETYHQWYLSNFGNPNSIAESGDYKKTIAMKEGVDISWVKMIDELPESRKVVVIAIIDDGIDYSHLDLQNAFWTNVGEIPDDGIDNDNNGYIDDIHGYDFLNSKGDVTSLTAFIQSAHHGTLCAGIIAAEKNNEGIVGIASCVDAKLMALKVMEGRDGIFGGDSSNLVKAIEYADKMGADICNLSLNYSEYDSEVEKAIQNSSMLFVVSAGNGAGRGIDIDSKASYPACYDADNLLVVANMDYSGELSISSNYGKTSVDVAAPGECIYTTFTNNRYIFASGTSMSAAIVSGVAAVLKAANNEADALSIKHAIVSSSIKCECFRDIVSSGGYVNALGALRAILYSK